MNNRQKPSPRNGSFKIGDRVTFEYGAKRVSGVIVEDLGQIGMRGRQMFVVEVPSKHDQPTQLELPEAELEQEHISTH